MKILFISQGGPTQDYLRDMVFHGLRSILGADVVDVNKLDSMYQGADKSQMYGKGFTLYGLLPDVSCDRSDIAAKINRKYFDLIVYGSIHRCQDYLHEVASKYRAPNVIFLDGEDHPGYLSGLGGITFKRELFNPQPGCLPIQFAIPKEKILEEPLPKGWMMAPCDPIDRKTYVYNTEDDYYAQYAYSYYAATMKKAGWDCLRHYEIMANWCIPYFRVFDQCPPLICENLPRPEILLVKQAIENKSLNHKTRVVIYEALIEIVMDALRDKLTTEALATYVLDKVNVATKVLA